MLFCRSSDAWKLKRPGVYFTNFLEFFRFVSGRHTFLMPTMTSLNNMPYHARPQKHDCPNPACGKSYKYSKNLKRHLKFECGIEPQQQCVYCSYVTRYKQSLMQHIQKQHYYRNVDTFVECRENA
jgi:uncharacterized C2H2 Zn-finger protein